jgi:hypothetical protein
MARSTLAPSRESRLALAGSRRGDACGADRGLLYILVTIPHAWRRAIVVVIAYTAVSTPIVTIQTLRLYWNASAAAKENRRVWGFTGSGSSDSNASA